MMIVAVGGADGPCNGRFLLFFSPNFFHTLGLSLCIDWDVMYSIGCL